MTVHRNSGLDAAYFAMCQLAETLMLPLESMAETLMLPLTSCVYKQLLSLRRGVIGRVFLGCLHRLA